MFNSESKSIYREHKDWSPGQWSLCSNESRFTIFQIDWGLRVSRDGGRRNNTPIMLCEDQTTLSRQSSDLVLLELFRSRFGNVMSLKDEVSQLPEYTQWLFHQWIYNALMAWAYAKTIMRGFIGLKQWKSGSGGMRNNFHTWIGDHRVQN